MTKFWNTLPFGTLKREFPCSALYARAQQRLTLKSVPWCSSVPTTDWRRVHPRPPPIPDPNKLEADEHPPRHEIFRQQDMQSSVPALRQNNLRTIVTPNRVSVRCLLND
jgi:hypothetical protein